MYEKSGMAGRTRSRGLNASEVGLDRIAILCPTRGRPRECFRMVQTALNTAAAPPTVQIFLGIDADDPKRAGYRVYHTQLGARRERCLLLEQEPGLTVSEIWNRLWRDACLNDLFLMGNDDLVFETEGWDDALREAVASWQDRIGVAWCYDGINGDKHAAFPCVSAAWCRHLGYFAPEVGMRFGFNDTWIYDLGHRIGRLRYLPNVTIRHDHHSVGGVKDETTLRHRGNTGKWPHDRRLFVETIPVREGDAEKLQAAIEKIGEASA